MRIEWSTRTMSRYSRMPAREEEDGKGAASVIDLMDDAVCEEFKTKK